MTEDSFDQRTAESLSELRAAMSGMEAPAEVKAAVLSDFRSIAQRRRKLRVALASWGAVAACLVLTAGGLYWRSARSDGPRQPQATALNRPSPAEARPVLPGAPKQVAAAPRQPVKRRARRTRRPPAETVDFVALPSAPPIDTAEGGSIVRVTLPRSAMRSFGIAVDELDSPDRVTADVMVGSDGMARAVRFVSLRSSR
jgi:hypothetical protein